MILLSSNNLLIEGGFRGSSLNGEGVGLEGGEKVRRHICKMAEGEDNEVVIGGISCVVVGVPAE